MANPYGIEQVDVPGILSAFTTARDQRTRQLLTERAMAREDAQLERETKLRMAYSKLKIPGADGSSGMSTAVSAYGAKDAAPAPPAMPSDFGQIPGADGPAAVSAPPVGPVAAPAAPGAPASPGATPDAAPHPLQGWLDTNSGAIQDIMQQDPQSGLQIMQHFHQLDAEKQQQIAAHLDFADKVNEHGLRLLSGVRDKPSWDAARRDYSAFVQQYGLPAPQLQEAYDPKYVQGLQMRALSVKEQIAEMKPVVLGKDSQLVRPTDGSIIADNSTPDLKQFSVHNADGTDTPYSFDPKTGITRQLRDGGGAASGTGGASAAAVVGGRLDPKTFFTQFVSPHEGGYAAHDANGAPVNHGINQSANPGVDVKSLSADQAAQIFADKYFKASGAANLPPALAAVVADTAFINPARAKQFLAQAGGDPGKFMDLREAWMANLVKGDPGKYGKYEKAWTNRNRDLRAYSSTIGSSSGGAADAAPSTAGTPITGKPGNPLSDDATRLAAAIYKTKGTLPPMIGRTKGDVDKIMNVAAHMTMDEAHTVADQTVGTWQSTHTAGQTLTAFSKGPEAKQTRSLSVALEHLELYKHAAAALQNGNVPVFNAMSQAIAKATGQPAPTNAQALHDFVMDEVTKGVVGAGMALQDRERASQILKQNSSPAQLAGGYEQVVGLLMGQLHGLNQQYKSGTGRDDFDRFLTPMASRFFKAYRDQHGGDGQGGGIARVANDADFANLPHGAHFIGPDGQHRVKP